MRRFCFYTAFWILYTASLAGHEILTFHVPQHSCAPTLSEICAIPSLALIIPHAESNHSAVQIHLSAYQSSLHLSRTYDLRSCLTASLTSEASSDFQQSRVCKTTSVTTLDSFRGKVDSLRGLGGSEETNQWP